MKFRLKQLSLAVHNVLPHLHVAPPVAKVPLHKVDNSIMKKTIATKIFLTKTEQNAIADHMHSSMMNAGKTPPFNIRATNLKKFYWEAVDAVISKERRPHSFSLSAVLLGKINYRHKKYIAAGQPKVANPSKTTPIITASSMPLPINNPIDQNVFSFDLDGHKITVTSIDDAAKLLKAVSNGKQYQHQQHPIEVLKSGYTPTPLGALIRNALKAHGTLTIKQLSELAVSSNLVRKGASPYKTVRFALICMAQNKYVKTVGAGDSRWSLT